MCYRVRLSVRRIGGRQAWGSAAGDFERCLEAQANAMISGPQIEWESWRGRDFVHVVVVMTVMAADVGQALVIAWRAFPRAAGDGIEGWDVAGLG